MKNKRIVIGIFILLLLNSLYVIKCNDIDNYTFKHFDFLNIEEKDLKKYTFHKGDILEQKFMSNDNHLYKVRIYVKPGTVRDLKYFDAYLKIGLKDSDGNIITEYKLEKFYYDDSYELELEFTDIKDSRAKEYSVYLESYKNSNFTIYYQENNENSENYLMINNHETNGSLMLDSIYKSESKDGLQIIILIILIIAFLIVFFINYKMKNGRLENRYLVIGIFISICMIFLTPAFIGQDECGHWARIYEISDGNLVSDIIDDWPQSEISDSVLNLEFHTYDKISMVNGPYNIDSKSYANMEYTSVYSPISYLPQIIGLKIARIFTNTPLIWFYVARIFEAIFCIICVYYAIKIIPFGKNMVFIISLIPSFVKATTLLSADALLCATTLLFVAKLCEIIFNKKKLNKKDFTILLISSLIIALSKIVYYPLCFLLILIPLNLKSKDSKRKTILILVITTIIAMIWNLIALYCLQNGQGGNFSIMLMKYLTNPLEYIQITFYTFEHSIGNFISDVFGGENAWFGTVINDASIIPIIFMALFFVETLNNKVKMDKKSQIVISCILLCTYLLISTSLLVSCTPVYHDEIMGIQGRYFIPFLIFIYLIFPKIEFKKQLNIDYTTIILLVYFSFYSIYFLRFI